MSLQRRLTIFTVTLVTLLSGLLGGFLIKQDFDGAINQIRTELTFIKDSVADSKEDKVTTAVALARSAPFQISVSLVDENGDVTPILEPDEEPQNTIELLVEIEGGSQLKLSASTSGELERRNSSIGNLLIFLISIAALSIIILRLVISRDVERERRAIELAEHLKSENEKRLALLEFAGDASHELRTPLTVIKGYLELGAKSKDIISSPETISKLQREVQRMESTIGSLLEVFEIDAIPSEELESKNISLLLTDAIKTFCEINPNRVVNSEIEEDLFIKSNDSLIHAVLGNALNNISRHTPHELSI
ncbi:MAG: sensor histidine kinase [Actinobacteria bacterium]|nr:sensor histidine kinase [Actinomycetota bacterium]